VISRIRGRLKKRSDDSVLVDVNGISYSVILPFMVMKSLDGIADKDGMVELVTYHYFHSDMTRSIPMLIGFLNEIEREFFEKFITVSGIGPRGAVRALNLPISEIARAIDEGDIPKLKSLPGIGEQRARDIVAKLQGRVGKFGLIQDGGKREANSPGDDIKLEALEVLFQLKYNRKEAMRMVDTALKRSPEINSVEELLNEVYKQKTTGEVVR